MEQDGDVGDGASIALGTGGEGCSNSGSSRCSAHWAEVHWDNTGDTAIILRNDHRRIVDAESWGRRGH
ncbi:hypothetical protein ACFTZI_00845 [Streptomyces decoyicus]|uniref:hypothetical protein n=1 Tax=Streptomyces decoyicus TaxID=249567 RepID=UPI00363077F0